MTTFVDPAQCPLCGQPNHCAMEIAKTTGKPQEACWCASLVFTAETLSKIPTQAQNKACICFNCANKG